MPVAAATAGLIDYFIALSILCLMMIWYGVTPNPAILFLPFSVLFSYMAAIGVGMWLSALNVKYRDIRYVVPFLIQLWLFATPVIYPNTLVPEKYRWLISLNPMSGVIDAHRACILGHKSIDWYSLGISLATTIVLLITGIFYFRRMEEDFADII